MKKFKQDTLKQGSLVRWLRVPFVGPWLSALFAHFHRPKLVASMAVISGFNMCDVNVPIAGFGRNARPEAVGSVKL